MLRVLYSKDIGSWKGNSLAVEVGAFDLASSNENRYDYQPLAFPESGSRLGTVMRLGPGCFLAFLTRDETRGGESKGGGPVLEPCSATQRNIGNCSICRPR
jgi:hypothetical protein